MNFTIVVATYNAESCLEGLLHSIRPQKNQDVELIIIDGGSNDNTVSIIETHNEIIDFWISEPDKGIYDAWNKGIKYSNGDWILFLGADDFLSEDSITIYNNFLSSSSFSPDLEYICAKVQMLNSAGDSIWVNGDRWGWPQFQKKMTVAHPGSLHSRKLFETYGLYDLNYKISGDYELLLRPRNKLKAAYINNITAKMTEGGVSDSWNGIKEYIQAAVKTGGANPFMAATLGFYMLLKANINTVGRKFGFNFNRKR